MIYQNIKHESRLLSRNYWFIALSLILLVLCLYAGQNGHSHFQDLQVDQQNAIAAQQEKENTVKEVALALSQGKEHPRSYRVSPVNIAIWQGRLATLSATSMSKMAIGQSDLYTHQMKISSREDLATLSFNELNNPVQLLFGSFDLSFVITYLIPLIIIAFTYNLRSQELESGRLKLLASNPISTNRWLLQRFVIRFCSLSLILTFVLLVTVFSIEVNFSFDLLLFFILTYAYVAFWFAISYLVNILGRSTARNAVSMLSIWILLVLIVPTVINQAANTVYPMPSRVALLNQIRETKKELSAEQDEVLDEYLRNHPELIRNEGENQFAYWQGYFASQEMTEKRLSPIVDRFDEQLSKQQKWVDSWGFLSPAVLFQNGITQLAGTSSKDYNRFKDEVKAFSLEWRSHFLPYVFENQMVTYAALDNLPQFEYRQTKRHSSIFIYIGALFLLALLISVYGLSMEGKRKLLETY